MTPEERADWLAAVADNQGVDETLPSVYEAALSTIRAAVEAEREALYTSLACDGEYPCWKDEVSGKGDLCWIHAVIRARQEPR